MSEILYLDIEASLDSKIYEYGLVYNSETLRTSSLDEAKKFIQTYSPKYIAGHNFIDFDHTLLSQTSLKLELDNYIIIDTLPASLLLFNEKTFHSLPKKYKNEDNFYNNPVEDSYLTRILLTKVVDKFKSIPKKQQMIFYSLLYDEKHFNGFLTYLDEALSLEILVEPILEKTIAKLYESVIVNQDVINPIMKEYKVELAYILALLTPVTEIKAHPPKILFDYPKISDIQKSLCFNIEKTSEDLGSYAEVLL